ncbi:hypothetical protein [Phycicoccus avicenniae]|uniref:hypothetical protein n=1 Tax=Phycicoccus avicenniae TaxID=2828860 RepID=UPI003D2C1A54
MTAPTGAGPPWVVRAADGSEDSLGYRHLESATWRVTELPRGRRRVTIVHRPLAGLEPEDLLWWFSHIGGSCHVDGEETSRYRAWHPRDHLHWALERPGHGGGADEGARFRIVEAFGAVQQNLIDVVERVEKLDATGIRLVQRRLGVRVFMLEHTWSPGVEGTHYVSTMEIGSVLPGWLPVNWWLTRRVMPAHRCRAWVRHNVEEVGRLEGLVPLVRGQSPAD